jgi:hypothetical protein
MAFGGLLSHSRIATEWSASRVVYRWFARGILGPDDIVCRGPTVRKLIQSWGRDPPGPSGDSECRRHIGGPEPGNAARPCHGGCREPTLSMKSEVQN